MLGWYELCLAIAEKKYILAADRYIEQAIAARDGEDAVDEFIAVGRKDIEDANIFQPKRLKTVNSQHIAVKGLDEFRGVVSRTIEAVHFNSFIAVLGKKTFFFCFLGGFFLSEKKGRNFEIFHRFKELNIFVYGTNIDEKQG